ncbi:hypothetical protein HOLleu_20726 [Holothuria leucospilota]|uniref:Uncharacterized protein n=1 Tax=Holothuria leucospilota TaxID=206669 RepID=A0A9Q1C1K0_HOLLE|nr:hypothetical protein HOLleu_20726 [Holothuria leucospilota]
MTRLSISSNHTLSGFSGSLKRQGKQPRWRCNCLATLMLRVTAKIGASGRKRESWWADLSANEVLCLSLQKGHLLNITVALNGISLSCPRYASTYKLESYSVKK